MHAFKENLLGKQLSASQRNGANTGVLALLHWNTPTLGDFRHRGCGYFLRVVVTVQMNPAGMGVYGAGGRSTSPKTLYNRQIRNWHWKISKLSESVASLLGLRPFMRRVSGRKKKANIPKWITLRNYAVIQEHIFGYLLDTFFQLPVWILGVISSDLGTTLCSTLRTISVSGMNFGLVVWNQSESLYYFSNLQVLS